MCPGTHTASCRLCYLFFFLFNPLISALAFFNKVLKTSHGLIHSGHISLTNPLGRRPWKNFIFSLLWKNWAARCGGGIGKRERDKKEEPGNRLVRDYSVDSKCHHSHNWTFSFPLAPRTHFSFNGMWQWFYFSFRSNEKRLPFFTIILNRLVGSNITWIIWNDRITQK